MIKSSLVYLVADRGRNDMGAFNRHPARATKRIFREQTFRTITHQHLLSNLEAGHKADSIRNIRDLSKLTASSESRLRLVSLECVRCTDCPELDGWYPEASCAPQDSQL